MPHLPLRVSTRLFLSATFLAACSSPPSQPTPKAMPRFAGASSPNESLKSPDLSALLGPDAVAKQHFLDTYIDKTAIRHSYHAHSGDFVDCVDIERQPGMTAPEMQGKAIATPPPGPVPAPQRPAGTTPPLTDGQAYAGTLDETGALRSCPDATVPIRRITPEALAPLPSLASLHTKFKGTPFAGPPPTAGQQFGNSYYMHANQVLSVQNVGMVGYISLWNPYIQSPSAPAYEHSIEQFWMFNTTGTTESAECGFATDPATFGDYTHPFGRLFIFATNDNYAHGNWNAQCQSGAPCFIQTWNGVTLGESYSAYSSIGGTVYSQYMTFAIYQGNVWFSYANNWVGYYPGSGFTYMTSQGAQTIEWGGEVSTNQPAYGNPWTTTQMGSGDWGASGEGYDEGYPAWVAGVRYMKAWGNNVDAEGTLQTNNGYDANCYNLQLAGNGNDNGGPGYDGIYCP